MNRSFLSKYFALALGGSERFRRNFLSIASANVAAQLIAIVFLPILTRLFSPDDFGILAIYTASQSVILAVSTGRFEWLVPNAGSASRVAALISLAFVALGVTLVLLLGAALLFRTQITALIGFPAESSGLLLLLLAVGVMAGGLQLIFQSWHVYLADLKTMSHSKLAQAAVTLGSSLGSGIAGAGSTGLVASYVAGFWAAVVMLLRGQRDLLRHLRAMTQARLRVTFRRFRGPVAAALALGVVNVLVAMSPIILLSRHYDETVVGWYSLVFRIATAPVTLVTTGLVHSFWADAADLAKTDPLKLRSFYLQSIGRLSLLGLIAVPIFIAGPLYIGPIFGAEWYGAGALLAAVTPYLFALIVFNPTTHLIVYGKQLWQLGCDAVTLAAVWLVFMLLARSGAEAWQAILGASLTLLCGYLLRAWLHLKANKVQVARISGK